VSLLFLNNVIIIKSLLQQILAFSFFNFFYPFWFSCFLRLSNILALSVIDDGYSRNSSWALHLISTILFDIYISINLYVFPFDFSHWILFYVIFTKVKTTYFLFQLQLLSFKKHLNVTVKPVVLSCISDVILLIMYS
jgi:hypothetical protein